jgi:Thymidylate synthase
MKDTNVMIKGRNINHVFYKLVDKFAEVGKLSQINGSKYLELYPVAIEIENPLERCLMVPNRRNNIFSTVAETIWVLSGSNKIEFLLRYLKRADKFSGDGETWRGAYGPRIMNKNGINQFENCVKALKKNENTARACIALYDPVLDSKYKQIDVPCNNWIQFYIKNDRLNMNVVLRANDLIWGFSGINFFEWSVLMEIASNWLGKKIGEYNHFVGNMVIFERHFDRAEKIKNFKNREDIYFKLKKYDDLKVDLQQISYKKDLEIFMLLEKKFYMGEIDVKELINREADIQSNFLKYCLRLLLAYMSFEKKNFEDFFILWTSLNWNVLKICSLEFLIRYCNKYSVSHSVVGRLLQDVEADIRYFLKEKSVI